MKDINRKKWAKIEMIGLILVMSSFLALIFSPDSLSNLFNCITAQVFPIVVDVFLTSDVGIAIVVSVIVGRIIIRILTATLLAYALTPFIV